MSETNGTNDKSGSTRTTRFPRGDNFRVTRFVLHRFVAYSVQKHLICIVYLLACACFYCEKTIKAL